MLIQIITLNNITFLLQYSYLFKILYVIILITLFVIEVIFMKSYCSKCGYTFSYKEKLKYYLFPSKYIECKCGKFYKASQTSLTIISLVTYLPLFCYLYFIDTMGGYSYYSFLLFIIWVALVWLLVPFFITIKEVEKSNN